MFTVGGKAHLYCSCVNVELITELALVKMRVCSLRHR